MKTIKTTQEKRNQYIKFTSKDKAFLKKIIGGEGEDQETDDPNAKCAYNIKDISALDEETYSIISIQV